MRARLLRTALAFVALASFSAPHVRLINSSNGNELYWSSPAGIGIVINSAGSDDITDGSHATTLRMAIGAWNDVSGTSAQLLENTSAAQQVRTDWDSDSIHLILFDEANASGFFPPGSSTVAITPVSFYSNGRIADADVLFNGSGFDFTTSGVGGAFDVGAVATHELGHLLGLDHSGWAGATLYPYVSPNVIAQRSLSLDDEHGLRHAYPSGSFGVLGGTVRRSADNSTVAGAHVVARDADGRDAGAALADDLGAFTIRGLDNGTYTVCAAPLDFPVSEANLTAGHAVDTDFEATVGGSVVVSAGSTTDYGDLVVGADRVLGLGRAYDELPLPATIGATTVHTLHGNGLVNTCTLTASDPAISVAPLAWSGGTRVDFSVTVPGGAASGHVDLEIVNLAGERSILVAGLELVPAAPSVDSVTPALSGLAGGTAITLDGSSFNAGARVVIGSRIYADGVAGGCTVVDASTITLTTGSTEPGTYDVVVIDASGLEGRADLALQFFDAPAIELVFPAVGSDVGGTAVVVSGANFVDPMSVRIDGVVQSDVTVVSSGVLRFTADAGVAGGPYVLELEESGGAIASAAFSYVAQADPALSEVSPALGATGGGTAVTLTGSNFSATTGVIFGADPLTGLGGTAATDVAFVDANTLTATTPAGSSGAVAVLVHDTSTEQATVLASAFTYQSSGGGGGGCSAASAPTPTSFSALLAGAGWIPLVLALLALERRRARRALAAAN